MRRKSRHMCAAIFMIEIEPALGDRQDSGVRSCPYRNANSPQKLLERISQQTVISSLEQPFNGAGYPSDPDAHEVYRRHRRADKIALCERFR